MKQHKTLLKIKALVFAYYWILPLVALLVAVRFVTSRQLEKPEFICGAIGGIFALMFYIQKQKLEEHNFFQQMFSRFNDRYDSLNDMLSTIKDDGSPLTDEQNKKLVDYFNLCSEEYLIFRQGYIPLNVWKAWMAGIEQYWRIQKVKEKWERELRTNSYYEFDPAKEIERARE